MIPGDDDLLRELLQTFHVEAAEHIQTLNQALLKLERQPEEAVRKALVQEAFRAAHSLKGAARAVDFSTVERLAHTLEEVLKRVRDTDKPLDPTTCDVLYRALDSMLHILEGEPVEIEPLVAQLNAIIGIEGVETVAPVAASPSPSSPSLAAENDETIRVAVSKLDALMAQAGELLIARISAEQRQADMQAVRQEIAAFPRLWREIRASAARLSHNREDNLRLSEQLQHFDEAMRVLSREINALDASINRDALRLGMVTGRLQSEMRRIRMVPFQTLEPLFQRTVRDAARSEGKQVELTIRGGDTELDKKVLESLKDPFLHLLRNAVSHGIETPDVRQTNGKPPVGQITVSVVQRGSEAHIRVVDDGCGFNLEKLRRAAEARSESPGGSFSPDEIISLAFQPGVSTSEQATAISGRGVGLDVVRRQLEILQGRVQVENNPGQGAAFHLIVPVSLAMTRVLLVQAASQRFALPLASIEKIVSPDQTFSVEGQAMLSVGGRSLPLVPLASLLGLPLQPISEPLAIIMGAADQRIALVVDDVLTEQELAVKPFGKPVVRVQNLAGAAVLGNGEPVVVLNTADLVKSARGVRVQHITNTPEGDKNGEKPVERILVVDDSITTRTLEKNILEAAGYEIYTATDGLQAIQQLKAHPVSLVVADIEMPNMDGISLSRYLRDSKEFKDLPIILVTSLESAEDRERGMMAGANAYIVKRGFNQAELLSTIRQYL